MGHPSSSDLRAYGQAINLISWVSVIDIAVDERTERRTLSARSGRAQLLSGSSDRPLADPRDPNATSRWS